MHIPEGLDIEHPSIGHTLLVRHGGLVFTAHKVGLYDFMVVPLHSQAFDKMNMVPPKGPKGFFSI